MRLLLDTHVLIWAASSAPAVGPSTVARISEFVTSPDNELHFSAAAIWEVAVKRASHRRAFPYEADVLRRELLAFGYVEVPINGTHAVAARALPPIHKDPFDRIMIAQAQVEGLTLLTHDRDMLRYPGAMLSV